MNEALSAATPLVAFGLAIFLTLAGMALVERARPSEPEPHRPPLMPPMWTWTETGPRHEDEEGDR